MRRRCILQLQETVTLTANCCPNLAEHKRFQGPHFVVLGDLNPEAIDIRPERNEIVVLARCTPRPALPHSPFTNHYEYVIVRCSHCDSLTFHIHELKWRTVAPEDWRKQVSWHWPSDISANMQTLQNLASMSFVKTVSRGFLLGSEEVSRTIGFLPLREDQQWYYDYLSLVSTYLFYSSEAIFLGHWSRLERKLAWVLPHTVMSLEARLAAYSAAITSAIDGLEKHRDACASLPLQELRESLERTLQSQAH